MIICSQCGTKLYASVKFCPKCGSSMENANVNEPPVLNPLLESAMGDYIKSQITLSNNDEVIGMECLKCGSKRNIVVYYHSEKISSNFLESRRTTRSTTKGIKVPLCSNCNKELLAWKDKHSNERNANQNTIIGDIILTNTNVILVIAIVIIYIYFTWAVFIPILIIILEFVYIGYRRLKKNQPNGPFSYIKFRGSIAYVRPRGEGSWIKYDTWLNSIH